MKVGLLWREEWDAERDREHAKLHGMFSAFAALGAEAEPVVYSDPAADAVLAQLRELDGVLVWVNPIEQGRDRSTLDPVLREAAAAGVFVSAHPDTILRLGTKDVLVETRELAWGSDTRVHRSLAELRDRLEGLDGPLVLKQHRGMGGGGVWKVEPAADGGVLAQHAAGGAAPERMTLAAFLDRCAPYFAGTGRMVEQPYQARLPEGMIRAYLSGDEVVGFTHQFPRGLLPPGTEPGPAGKEWRAPDDPRHAVLRARLEREWVPELQQVLGLETAALPVIWDADFLLGDGEDAYVLCEINCSSTFAFPEFAMPTVARNALGLMA